MRGRYDVLGCEITPLTMAGAVHVVIRQARKESGGGYVCFTNVHASVMAREQPEFKAVVNESLMSLPDGKPVYWLGRIRGIRELEQIPGPDFFPALLSADAAPPLRHYFFGGKREVLDALIGVVEQRFPHARVVGSESPPFRELDTEETRAALARISVAKPDFVWVGLGAPKQELWMAKHWQKLRPAVLLGVGAAFDFHSAAINRAPPWVRQVGFEWLYRLAQEPRRLWRRYIYSNAMFIYYLLTDGLRAKGNE